MTAAIQGNVLRMSNKSHVAGRPPAAGLAPDGQRNPPAPPRDGTRAISLLSGGLDSQLAVAVLRAQGIEVLALAFDSPFFNVEPAREAAAALGVPLRVIDFTDDILALLDNPPHGFGACLNPCRDCHARMIARAGEVMRSEAYHLIATGEVLNQRPLSQTRQALALVARESGVADWLLRPLSARLLPETRLEREGWVDRARLLKLEGRGRKRQMALARTFGIHAYPTPAGGCRLTEPNYCRRLRDLMAHEGLQDRRQLALLRIGRHFRLPGGHKLVVGRHQADNRLLDAQASTLDVHMWPAGMPGPSLLLPNGARAEAGLVTLALRVGAAYADCSASGSVFFCLRRGDGHSQPAKSVRPLSRDEAQAWLV